MNKQTTSLQPLVFTMSAETKKATILITGGVGFVGSHICEGILKETNWDIIILDKYSYAGNFNRLTNMD